MVRKAYIVVVLIFLVQLISSTVEATHIRAGELSAERLSATTYRFTLVLYADFKSVADSIQNGVPTDVATIVAQGQEITKGRSKPYEVVGTKGYKTQINTYVFEKTFSSTGSSYTVSFTEQNRNGGIANINNGSSDQVPFHIAMQIFPSVSDPINSAPVLKVPPIDEAAVNRVYSHNPGAYDPDGDSLSFKLITPTQANGVQVPGYLSPDNIVFGVGSKISVNPITGDLIWDTPKMVGIYNVAIEVTEWGTSPLGAFVKSVTVRDMQINVVDSDNKPPVVIAPNDTCIEAGYELQSVFKGYDPNGDSLRHTFFGGILDDGARFDFAKYTADGDSLLSINFTWTPSCDMAQVQPHALNFKLTDDYSLSLSTISTYQISVKLPAPKLTAVTDLGTALQLDWEPYLCNSTLKEMKVWRITCDTSGVQRNACTTGVPSSWSASLVAILGVGVTTFVDPNVEVGETYCYLLTSIDKKGNESIASNILCGALKLTAPLITKVDVLETSTTTGKIQVSWASPIEVDTSVNKGPFRYDVYRAEGISNLNFGTSPLLSITATSLKDSSFIDSLLNTSEKNYTYKIEFFNNGLKVATSFSVSNQKLSGAPKFKRIILSQESKSNFQYPDSLAHQIYRVFPDSIVVFETLYGDVNGQSITGLNNLEEYCLFMDVQGVFCGIDVEGQPFISRSNVFCVTPYDSIPPCPPVLTMDTLDCTLLDETTSLSVNQLQWTGGYEEDENCENDVVGFKLFYKAPFSNDFEELNTFKANEFNFTHQMKNNRAGCYYVIARDETGLESEPSNIVCNDNCELIEFPNIITPNGDFKNDFFRPLPTPRNVQSLVFEVYNRWGKLVYKSSDDVDINWDGRGFGGELLNMGVYYYSATVTFYKLNPEDQEQVFKGWVLLSR